MGREMDGCSLNAAPHMDLQQLFFSPCSAPPSHKKPSHVECIKSEFTISSSFSLFYFCLWTLLVSLFFNFDLLCFFGDRTAFPCQRQTEQLCSPLPRRPHCKNVHNLSIRLCTKQINLLKPYKVVSKLLQQDSEISSDLMPIHQSTKKKKIHQST